MAVLTLSGCVGDGPSRQCVGGPTDSARYVLRANATPPQPLPGGYAQLGGVSGSGDAMTGRVWVHVPHQQSAPEPVQEVRVGDTVTVGTNRYRVVYLCSITHNDPAAAGSSSGEIGLA